MQIKTRTLGAVEATHESFVTLPEGLIGYDDQREFALVASADHAPFRWLLSFADPDVTFPLLPAALVVDDYRPALASSDTRVIGAVASDALEVYVIASVDADGRLTANLRAPIVLNPTSRLARQVVLSDGRWTVDHVIAAANESTQDTKGERTRQAA